MRRRDRRGAAIGRGAALLDASDLAALAALDALLQHASVTGAARQLGLSVPAASHALARLRERLGDPLLVRAGRSMVLTPRARELQPRVREALAAAGRVFDEPEFSPDRLRGPFTLSATDYVLHVFGRALDERLRTGAPALDLRVVPNAVDDDERLRAGQTDLAVGIYGEIAPELRTRPIITDRFVCVVRTGHPAARGLTPEAFAALEHVQVAPRGQPGGYVDEVLAARGLQRRVARAVPYFQVALELVAASDRILTVSERIARAAAARLELDVLEPPVPLEPFALSMVWHPRFDADPAHRWIREQLVAVTAEADALTHPRPRRRLSPRDPTAGRPPG